MSLFERIQEREDQFSEISAEIKKNGFPTMLYGKGEYAKILLPFLKQYRVPLTGVLADGNYFVSGQTWEGFVIKEIGEVLRAVEGGGELNLLIAYGAWRDFQNQLSDWRKLLLKKIEGFATNINVFFYDCYGRMNYEFLEQNRTVWEELYRRLSDQQSHKVLEAFLNQRISGNSNYIPQVCSNDTYFPDEIIVLEERESFLDCGAYQGDSIELFLSAMERKGCRYEKIIAMEPDLENSRILQQNQVDQCKIIGKCAWNKEEPVFFEGDSLGGHITSDVGKGKYQEADTIDHLLGGEKITYIKMDIEGAELQALQGAKNTIQRYKPKLAICVYHKKEDLLCIPSYILSIRSDYKLFLRAHGGDSTEVVLYAI